MNFSRLFGFSAGLSVLLTAIAPPAMASCLLSDVGGTWQADVNDNYNDIWYRCKLVTTSLGAVANTSCNKPSGTIALTAAKFTLVTGATCTFAGTFTFGAVKSTLTHATMAKVKNTMSGVGTIPAGPSVGTFIADFTKP